MKRILSGAVAVWVLACAVVAVGAQSPQIAAITSSTCPGVACRLLEEFSGGSFYYVGTLHVCDAHAGIADGRVLYNTIKREMSVRSAVKKAALANQKLSQTFNNVTEFKEGVELVFEWVGVDDQRILRLSLLGASLTSNEQAAIVDAAASFGIPVTF